MIARAPKLNILILAAGYSTRLGAPKALARVHGMSLLRRTLTVSASLAAGKILVVVPRNYASYRVHARGFSARFLPNPDRAQGLASSVRLGVRRGRFASAILIVPVDLAELTSSDLARLLNCWRARPARLAAARIGRYGGIPLILPARLFAAAERLEGDVGLRSLLGGFAASQRALVPLPSAAFDIDTASELAAARRRWRATGR
jgi:molybdenum cofactor cytidylyltransferase